MLLGHVRSYSQLAPYGGDRGGSESLAKKYASERPTDSFLCSADRKQPDVDLKQITQKMVQQERRLNAMHDALEARGDLYADIHNSVVDLSEKLDEIKTQAGRAKAKNNVARATRAVLHLTDTFDTLDRDATGTIDEAELRRGLHELGMESHSDMANAIIERYTHNQSIDIKVFTTLVRDIHTLLTFDADGSGTLDTEELKPALESMGLHLPAAQVDKIQRAWDADHSGRLDLLEFTDLVRTLQTFMKYDKDGSGDIDVCELKPALRRLGIPADSTMANAILGWYDHDESGRIELYEFAVLARDASVFATFDKDHSGTLDAEELLPALSKLGLAASAGEVLDIIRTWDDNGNGTISLLEFAEIIRDLQVFEQFDKDRSGFISAAELRIALSKLGVQLSHPDAEKLMRQYDADGSGLIEFAEFRRLADDLPSIVGAHKDCTRCASMHAERASPNAHRRARIAQRASPNAHRPARIAQRASPSALPCHCPQPSSKSTRAIRRTCMPRTSTTTRCMWTSTRRSSASRQS